MKVTICVWFLLFILGGWKFWQNQITIEHSRFVLLEDQSTVSHLNQLKGEMEANPLGQVDATSLSKFEQEYKELLKSRGDYARLSQTKGWALQDLKRNVQSSLQQTIDLRRETELLIGMEKTREQSILIRRMFGTFKSVLMYLMKTDLDASDLQEVYRRISERPDSEEHQALLNVLRIYIDGDPPVNLAHCEIIERHISFGNGHRIVYLRERTHRELPDGTVGRWYYGIFELNEKQPKIGTKLFSSSPETLQQQEYEFVQSLTDSIVNFVRQY